MDYLNLCSKHFGSNHLVSVEVFYFLHHANVVILFYFKYSYVMCRINTIECGFFPSFCLYFV